MASNGRIYGGTGFAILALLAGAGRVWRIIDQHAEREKDRQPPPQIQYEPYVPEMPNYQRPQITMPRVEIEMPRYEPPRITQPPRVVHTPRVQPPSRTVTPSRPGRSPSQSPGRSPSAEPITPAAPPEPVRRELVLEHSPLPGEEALGDYAFWSVADGYESFLDRPTQVGAFALCSSVEFELKRKNPRAAEWDAPRGTAGVGLDFRVDRLYPRDAGLTSPVLVDEAGRQLFRMGRREERALGDATIQVLDHHGMLIWRVQVPATAGSDLATCYYTAIVDGHMAVLTARYDKNKPEQLEGFDAIAGTLTYSP